MKRGNVFRDRKLLLLAGLILLLVVVNLHQWGPGGGVLSRSGKEKTANHANTATEQDPILVADQLKTQQVIFEHEKRNIFSFFQKSALPPAPEETTITEAVAPQVVCGNSACEEGEDPANCPTDCQPPPPPSPVIALRYIGYMSEAGGSVAFLTDGKEVFMARVNDVVANQYRVLKITDELVELGYLNNNQSSTIRFQGNQGA